MPNSEITVKHRLSQQEALKRIKKLFGEAKKQHGDKINNLREDWTGNQGRVSFSVNLLVKGIPISGALSGALTVNPSDVKLSVDYPLAAAPLKGTVEDMLRNGAQKLLV